MRQLGDLYLVGSTASDVTTNGESPKPRSPQASTQTPQTRMAKLIASKLFGLLPPLDIADPEGFVVATIAIFAEYPGDVMLAAIDPVRGVPSRSDRPTLRLIKAVCDELYAPIDRAREREIYALRARPLPQRRPRSAEEQAAVDAHVAAVRRELGIRTGGVADRGVRARPLPKLDPRRERRLLEELERRKARNDSRASEDGHEQPEETS